jgi:hypothetical protein
VRGGDLLLARGRAEEDDRRLRAARADVVRRLGAVHVGQPEVHDDDLGLQLLARGSRRPPVRDGADDLEPVLPSEQEDERVAVDVVVLHEQHADRRRHSATRSSG